MSEKYIIANGDDQGYQPITTDDIIDNASNVCGSLSKAAEEGPVTKAFFILIKLLHRHRQAIDVLIQVKPDVAAVIWGPVRCLIDVILS